jgi:hypothetical protein
MLVRVDVDLTPISLKPRCFALSCFRWLDRLQLGLTQAVVQMNLG